MRFERCRMLFKERYGALEQARVLLLGVGGVGSMALDCLYRSGVRRITIVDYDTYDITNLNRQLWSEQHVGESKVEALQKHYEGIEALHVKVDEAWVKAFDFTPYDVVLDAIDDTKAKLALAQKCYSKLISATGSARKTDPTQVRVDSIWRTLGDPFAAKIRRELKRRRFDRNYRCVYSAENTVVKEKGSFMAVTGAFGLAMCAECIKKVTERAR